MRICHLSFSSTGGASKVADEIWTFQNKCKIDSTFNYLIKGPLKKNVTKQPKVLISTVIDNFILSNDHRNLFSLLRNKGTNISIDFSVERFDFIHLHWLPGLLNLDYLTKNISPYTKQIFWHVQDLNPLTGGCHYSNNCVENERKCYPCPQVRPIFRKLVSSNFDERIKSLTSVKNLSYIFPSYWVQEKYKKSNMPKVNNLVIPNPHTFTTPLTKYLYRSKFGLKLEDIVLGVVVGDVLERRKNISRVIEFFQKLLVLIPNARLLIIGSNSQIYAGSKILTLDSISNKSNLEELYSIMDFNFIFSSEETFGYTVVEAANQKVPSIVYNNSAVSELVVNGDTGYVFENYDDFVKILSSFDRVRNDFVGKKAFDLLYAKCNTKFVYNQYQKLYNMF